MRKNEHFESALPEGYEEALVVDAKNRKTSLLLTLASLMITAVVTVLGALWIKPNFLDLRPWELLIFAVIMLGYIVLHELVHGVAYKLLTGQKLTFGMTLTVAFCGVPTI